MTLLLSYFDTGDDGFISSSGGVYGILADDFNGTALNLATNPGLMSAFDGNHETFGIDMPVVSNRGKMYSRTLSASGVTIPATPHGQWLTIEYWVEDTYGVKNRDNDILLGTERFYYVNQKMHNNRVPIKADIHCSVSYDPVYKRMGFTVWMEKDGALIQDASSVTVKTIDSTDIQVASATTSIKNTNGEFTMTAAPIDLVPDENYFTLVRITDADGVVHIAGTSQVTWD